MPLPPLVSDILEDDIKAEPVMYDNACHNLYCILKLNKTHKKQLKTCNIGIENMDEASRPFLGSQN